MRLRLRTILLISFVASHAAVLTAGPSLHAILGVEHGLSGSANPGGDDRSGGPAHAPGHASHDCAACHLLSLTPHNPDSVVAFSAHSTGRVLLPLRVTPPPLEARSDSPSRAPPASHPDARTA
ncbi:DUF2946 family protein [Paludisphaera mucosa]|uniref:DUF2946 family protein n=1 Tax=Paludisphaera mucosa TaxID=3030827 RepID=A0ABT6FDV2_9BACT|nr:DUF2946 family protein [Paludisphaera mucosa]MDG3005729.1 DUF2946 family protein [Paludisphaera mucosa]